MTGLFAWIDYVYGLMTGLFAWIDYVYGLMTGLSCLDCLTALSYFIEVVKACEKFHTVDYVPVENELK